MGSYIHCAIIIELARHLLVALPRCVEIDK